MASDDPSFSKLSLDEKKKVKAILEWIEAYQRLVDLDIKYFELSINAHDTKMRVKYRQKSDQYNEAISRLIKLLP